MTSKDLKAELKAVANPEIAAHSQRFFKTGPGQYGEGDEFLGIRVPVLRKLVGKYRHLSLTQVMTVLQSKYHEERLLAVLIMVRQFKDGDSATQKRVFEAYLKNTAQINNWDLVDSSAHLIVGPWLAERDRQLLYHLAESDSLWERRIAMMSTFHYIRQNDYDDALKLAKILLHDDQDLIHKIVGWMLREIGNRDRAVEENFLNQHVSTMPRTMLRYAIEKFPADLRQDYLKRPTK